MKKIALAVAVLLIAAAAYASTIRATLSWVDSTGETSYRVERSNAPAGPWSPLASLPADTVSYVDNTLALGTTYCWRVIASSAVGDSLPSTAVCGDAPSLPTQPGGLQVIITVVP